MDSPIVSIIMPAYNAEKYIAESIQSVIDQTLTNWELLITDDGSIDETSNIIKSFNDKRIQLITQKNSGVSDARNEGLSLAIGKYITFLDADDILPSKSLKSRVDYLDSHSHVDLVDGKAIVKDASLKNTLKVHSPSYEGSLLPRLIKLDSQVYLTCYYMFRKSILGKTRFSILGKTRFQKNMTHSEDILFFIELASAQDVQYGYVLETVFIYRVGHTSAMSNIDGLEKGYLSLIQKVSELNNISFFQHIFLRIKIARILFLTWLRQKKITRAFEAIFQIIIWPQKLKFL
jgi:glycosyltransferase involved in cell wall biosynthesis